MPTAVITGANRGLGLGLAEEYLRDGWQVIALSRHSSPELEALSGPNLEQHTLELVDDRALAAMADGLSGRPIDVLINNAGRMAHREFRRGRESTQGFGYFDRSLWREVFDINVFTPMYLAELLADHVARAERGRIVTLSSMLGSMSMNTFGGIYAYRASKAGVNAIMKSMAIDLADRGIIAVALHPGWVRTKLGGKDAPLDVDSSVAGMKQVIDGLQAEDSGRFLGWDGSELPW